MSLTTGSGNTIKLTNTAGNFVPFDIGGIVLTVKGNIVSGANLILGNIAYIATTNSLLCPTCLNSSQGNLSTGNDNSQTSVTVNAPVIDSVNDNLIVVNGITSSVITNDTLNGILAVIGTAAGNVKLTATATPELSINTATGIVTVLSNTSAGTYFIPYTICEINNTTNCDTATVTVLVNAPIIDAVDDTLIAVNGITSSVITNDKLGLASAVIGTASGNVKLTTTATPELSINTVTGIVTVTSNIPAGTYSIPYTICEVNNPTNCDTATVTISITAPDFSPTLDIDNVVFLTAGVSKDFIVNIAELGLRSSIGQVVFVIPKLSAFTITYNATASVSSIGSIAINNNDWIISENSLFLKGTLKPNIVISAGSFSSIGFTISRKPNIPTQTWQNITTTIVNGSGSDSVNTNNTYNVLVKAQ